MSAREERDSVFAQMLADREGPRVRIQAQYTSLVAGSRRLRAAFRVEDDAYVLIGHVDAEGVVRIVFPSTPDDNGFVKGGRSYQSAEFFGGFTDAYRYRAQTYGRFAAFRPDAYDQQFGYLFIIASWRPMNTQQFATEGRWDSFEISERDMYDDPKPAIYELAALAAGENREAYTVEFARYYSTMNLSPGSGFGGTSAYGLCTSGYNTWRSFGFNSFHPISLVGRAGYNNVEWYRGRAYYFDSFAGCYSPAPYGYPYFQPRIAQTPPLGQPTSGVPTRGRVFSAADSPRQPVEPKPPVGSPRVAPIQARDIGPIDVVPSSPRYRDRGLITDDDTPPTRTPRVQVQAENTRPSISKMTERRAREATTDNSYRGGYTRARVSGDDGPPMVEPPRQRVTRDNGGNSGGNEGRTYSPRPEYASPPREPVAQPRVMAPAAERPSTPTPPSSTPRSEPPSTGAGSSVRPITPR